MPKDAPNFALLIGKPKGKSEESESDSLPTKEDHAKDLGIKSDKEEAENSAIMDLLDASKSGDVEQFKVGLKDFLELCYPQLSKEEDSEEY